MGNKYYISYTLNNLGWIYNIFGKYQMAIEKYIESLKYLDPNEHKDDLALVYINIGNAYHAIGHYQTVLNYFHKASSIIKELEDQSSLPISYNGLGLAYKYLGNFDSAAYYYKKNLELDENSGNIYGQAIDYGNIGALYFEFGQYEQAYDFHKLSLEIYLKEGKSNDLSVAYNNLGEVHKAMARYDSALYYLNKAIEIDKKNGLEQNMAVRYQNMGEVYFEQKDYKEALSYFNRSLQINKETGADYNIALNLKNIARVNQISGNLRKAEQAYNESLGIARQLNSKILIKSILEAISLFYEDTRQFEKAIRYHKMVDVLNDSLFKEKSQQMLADLQTRHELDQKEKEIALLNSENELHIREAKDYRNTTLFFGSALLIISGLLLILNLQYNLRKRAYKKLVQKNKELAVSQKEMNGNGNLTAPDNGTPDPENIKQKELYDKIRHYLKNEKPYLIPDITIKEMAEKMDTNTHYLSENINRNFGNSFTGLINEYRVKEACKLMLEENMDNVTIESIAYDAGFNSKSAFHVAFKKITGVTPSFYIKSIKEEIN